MPGEGVVRWISSGPEDGLLVGGVGFNGDPTDMRGTDHTSFNIVLGVVEPPSGLSNVQYFLKLINASNDYCNCVDYDLFPGISNSYNSNSYLAGLMKHTGGTTNIGLSQYYGGAKPLPSIQFPNTKR